MKPPRTSAGVSSAPIPTASGSICIERRDPGPAKKLNSTPLIKTTDFVDTTVDGGIENIYTVRAVVRGKELTPSAPFVLPAAAPIRQFISVPLQRPAGGEAPGPSGAPAPYTYNANDASVGDLDGDGEYEIVLKWDPSNSRDTASRGVLRQRDP